MLSTRQPSNTLQSKWILVSIGNHTPCADEKNVYRIIGYKRHKNEKCEVVQIEKLQD